MIVQYTPGQLRSILGIPQETYRHWKKALAPLRRDRGHSPSFTAGDLLAIELVRVLSADLSIRVGSLAPVVSSVFEQCNTVPWPILERGAFCFDLLNYQAVFQADGEWKSGTGPIILIPLRPVVARLRERLLPAGEDERQEALRFPLTPVGQPAAQASGGRT